MLIWTKGWVHEYPIDTDVVFNAKDILYAYSIGENRIVVALRHNMMGKDGNAETKKITCNMSMAAFLDMLADYGGEFEKVCF